MGMIRLLSVLALMILVLVNSQTATTTGGSTTNGTTTGATTTTATTTGATTGTTTGTTTGATTGTTTGTSTGTTSGGTTTAGATGSSTATTPTDAISTITALTLGVTFSPQFAAGCVAYYANLGNQIPIVQYNVSMDNVQFVVADFLIPSLTLSTALTCPNNGSLCQSSNIQQSNAEIDGISCLNTVYIYACNPSATLASLDILVTASTDPCIAINDPTNCLGNSASACYQNDTCDPTCQYVNCNVQAASSVTNSVGGFCLPTSLSNSDTNNFCNTLPAFQAAAASASTQILACIPAVTVGSSGSPVIKGILIAILFILLLVLLASCFYRYKMNKDRIPPFTPPRFCPNILFPAPDHDDDMVTLNSDNKYNLLNK